MSKKKPEQTEQEWKDHADEVNYIRVLLLEQITKRQDFKTRKENGLLSDALSLIDEYRNIMDDKMAREGKGTVQTWYPSWSDQHGNDIRKGLK